MTEKEGWPISGRPSFFGGSSGFTVKEYSPQRPSAAEPQPKNLGIGELTTKGAKNAKKKSDYLAQRRKGAKEKNGFRT
jgi:hypothetical protein